MFSPVFLLMRNSFKLDCAVVEVLVLTYPTTFSVALP